MSTDNICFKAKSRNYCCYLRYCLFVTDAVVRGFTVGDCCNQCYQFMCIRTHS